MQSIDKLTPQPYTILSQTAAPAKPLWLPRLRRTIRLLFATAPLMLLLVKLISFSPPPLLDLCPRVETALRPYQQQCVKITQQCTKITDGVAGTTVHITLAGRVSSEAQRHTISSVVQTVEGVSRINDDKLEVIPRPACEVIDLLEPLQEAYASGMSMTLKKGLNNGSTVDVDKASPIYYLDDNLLIEVKLPFKSYVYVDYYDTKENLPSLGEVTHLFPSYFEPQNLKQPGTTFMIGNATSTNPIKIGLPAGRDLVTVIASKSQLLAVSNLVAQGKTLQLEPAESYLAKLRQALQGITKSDVIATFTFLHNHGKKPEQ